MRWMTLILLAGCATSDVRARRDAIRAHSAELELANLELYRGHEGFREARWGMSEQEMETAPTSTTVDGMPAVVAYSFARHRLVAVSVTATPVGDVRQQVASLRSAMALKYGQPVDEYDNAQALARALRQREASAAINNDIYENALRSNEPMTRREAIRYDHKLTREEHAEHLSLAVDILAALHVARNAEVAVSWSTAESDIGLYGAQSSDGAKVQIIYRSRALAPLAAAEADESARAKLKRTASEL